MIKKMYMSDWPKRRRHPLGVPHPNSPAGRNFDYDSALGVPHPNSPAGRDFDYDSALGLPHPSSPAARAGLHHILGQARQASHDWGALAAERADQLDEALEDRKEIVLRIFNWIKDKALAPLAVTDPLLFAEFYAHQSLRDFREARHDRGKLRDLVIEDLEHIKDAVEELEKLKASENVAEHLLSRIGGTVWGVVSDPEVVRGFIDLFKIKNLNERGRGLDERQEELTKRCALIKSEIEKCIQLIRNRQPSGRLQAKRIVSPPPASKPTPQPNTSQRRADPSPDAARGLRVELISDPVLPSRIAILNAPTTPPEILHGAGLVANERGKCEEEAKRVLELDTKLEDLRRELDELERERDDVREQTKDCPELYRQDEELRRKRERLRAELLAPEAQIRNDRRVISTISTVEQGGGDTSELQSDLYAAEREVRRLNNELAIIEHQWEKVRYELGKCPRLDQIESDAKELDRKINQIRQEISRTEKELKEAEQALEKCRENA